MGKAAKSQSDSIYRATSLKMGQKTKLQGAQEVRRPTEKINVFLEIRYMNANVLV